MSGEMHDAYVERLEEAIRSININDYEDHIYYVRESSQDLEDGYVGGSWDHPNVSAYTKSIDLIREVKRELDE